MPNPSETMPRRSPRLSKHSSSTSPSAYIQVIDNETTSSDSSLPENHAQTDSPEGYIHFTFDENEWCNLSNEDDPILYRDTFSRPNAPFWQAAYEDEMKSLREHKVWDLIPHDQVLTGRKVIPSKPVFHYKWDSDRKIIHYKVHVIAKGFAQKPGIDYTDTYAPVGHLESTRTILHISTSLDWEIHQMDTRQCFYMATSRRKYTWNNLKA